MEPHPIPFAAPQDLPPYLGILAVDAKGFTAEPGSTHQAISGLIPRLVGKTFSEVGLGEVWDDPVFFGPTGDGFAVGVPTRVLPYLVHPFLDELQRVLADHNTHSGKLDALLRLRVSLNVGPLPADPADLYLGGNGTPRNDTHRLLDSSPVRTMLARAKSSVTFVAAILSDRVFQDVVVAGYAGRHPDHFLEVSAAVEEKEFVQRAWLCVPEPSGNLLLPEADGRPAPNGETVPTEAEVPKSVANVGKNYGQIAAGTVYGGMTMHRGADNER